MTTVVDGKLLMRDREVLTIDEAALRASVARKSDEIRSALAATDDAS